MERVNVDGLQEIQFDDIALGDVITVTFVNAGRSYSRFGRVGSITDRGVIYDDRKSRGNTYGNPLIHRGIYTSKYDSDVHIYRGLPNVIEPQGFGAVVRARPKHFAPGTFAYLMRVQNIDPKTYVNNEIWMQLSDKLGKPYMYRWENLEVWEVIDHGTQPARVGLAR